MEFNDNKRIIPDHNPSFILQLTQNEQELFHILDRQAWSGYPLLEYPKGKIRWAPLEPAKIFEYEKFFKWYLEKYGDQIEISLKISNKKMRLLVNYRPFMNEQKLIYLENDIIPNEYWVLIPGLIFNKFSFISSVNSENEIISKWQLEYILPLPRVNSYTDYNAQIKQIQRGVNPPFIFPKIENPFSFDQHNYNQSKYIRVIQEDTQNTW